MKANILIGFLILFSGCSTKTTKKIEISSSPENCRDAIISRAYPTNNYGSLKYLHLTSRMKSDSLKDDNRFVLDIRTEDISRWAMVDSAFIFLKTNTGQNFRIKSLFVERIKDPWSEKRINWENRPEVDTLEHVKVGLENWAGEELKINVTSFFRDFVKRKSRNLGFLFKLTKEDLDGSRLYFYSSDHAEENKRPRLEIYYTANEWF